MKKIIITTSVRRFLELLITNIAISAVITWLNQIGFLFTRTQVFYALFAGAILSLAIDVTLMRHWYYKLTSKAKYHISNYIAHGAFLFTNLFVGVVFDQNVYAWLFSIAKVARFSPYHTSSLVSALIFNGILIIAIHLAPIGMGWILVEEDY